MNHLLQTQIAETLEAVAQAKQSQEEDTKSSAGDKYETGRAMIQQEIDKHGLRLSKLQQLKKELSLINPSHTDDKIGFGSLATINGEKYFISIALGKIALGGQEYYALSLAAPICQMLKGKRAGERVAFQGREMRIESVC